MAIVIPFRAWRYHTDTVDGYKDVLAPPYDVIGPELQDELYRRSPHNVVRVDLPREEPEPGEEEDRYKRAAATLRLWKKNGALVRDPVPTVTVVEEDFTGPDGIERTRGGILACLRLEEFSAGVVYPHEATLSGPKKDRYRLMESTNMNLSPVFLLYSSPVDAVMSAWDEASDGRDPQAAFPSPTGTFIRLWPTSEPALIQALSWELAQAKLFIADGHHRYETVLKYRNERWAQGLKSGPWEYGLVYLANMEDPGLAIFGTHRLLEGLPEQTVQDVPQILSPVFDVEELTTDPAAAELSMRRYLESHYSDGDALGVYAPQLGRALGIKLRDEDALAQAVDPERSDAYRHLDVTVLHSLILEKMLEISPDDVAAGRHVSFHKSWKKAMGTLESNEAQVGFFMNPTRLDQVREVAGNGERMPQKSTYFYPKLPTGLAFHELRDLG